jgi:hypothetical protein
MLPIPGEEPLWKVLQVRGILAKCKDLIARNQETERPGACPTTSPYPIHWFAVRKIRRDEKTCPRHLCLSVATDYRRNSQLVENARAPHPITVAYSETTRPIQKLGRCGAGSGMQRRHDPQVAGSWVLDWASLKPHKESL